MHSCMSPDDRTPERSQRIADLDEFRTPRASANQCAGGHRSADPPSVAVAPWPNMLACVVCNLGIASADAALIINRDASHVSQDSSPCSSAMSPLTSLAHDMRKSDLNDLRKPAKSAATDPDKHAANMRSGTQSAHDTHDVIITPDRPTTIKSSPPALPPRKRRVTVTQWETESDHQRPADDDAATILSLHHALNVAGTEPACKKRRHT